MYLTVGTGKQKNVFPGIFIGKVVFAKFLDTEKNCQ